ncbi:MAG: DUF835 domain-containing protein [Candidatus Woesearchaeota archaeon]|nr:DUF835 domain-containing protein [Candidatus Woesearchaeota archaeon]
MAAKSNYNQLIILTIGMTLIIIFSFVFIERFFNSKIEETRVLQYQNQQLQIAIQTSSSLKDFVEYIKNELISLSLSSPPKGYYSIEKKYLSNYYGSLIDSIVSVVKTDKEGRIVRTSERYMDYDYGSIIKDYHFDLAQVNQDAVVTQVYVDGSPFLLVIVPVYEESRYSSTIKGDFDGVIAAAIDIHLVEELYFSQIKTGMNSRIWLMDNRGIMLSSPLNWMTLKKGDDFFDWVKNTYPMNSDNINRMIAEKEGSLNNGWYPYPDSISSYSYSYFSAGYGWIVLVDTPKNEITEGILPLQQKMLYFLIALLVSFSAFFIVILVMLRSKEKTEVALQKAELTLEKLGIIANPEKGNVSKMNISLKGNHIYMIQAKKDGKALEFFLDILGKEYLGLIISRENTEFLRKEFGVENTPIIRLGNPKSKEDRLSMIDCKDLFTIMKEFMDKNENAAIYLDRLDYIFENNGFNKTIRFIYDLKDAMSKDSIILLSVNTQSLSSKQLSLVSEEAQDITNLVSADDLKLQKDIYEILSFINFQNSSNKKVVFKDVSVRFDITKPTTKKKIMQLVSLNLISIEESGREKSLVMTQQGKELISKQA